MPLQMEASRLHAGKYGRVRVRCSVHWDDDSLPMRRTIAPPPRCDLVITSWRYLDAARFVRSGSVREDEFAMSVLLDQVRDLAISP